MRTRATPPRWVAFVCLAVLLVGGACSNDSPDDRRAGTETGSWGLDCSSDAVCGELSCLCGICTASCDDATGCDVFSCQRAADLAACLGHSEPSLPDRLCATPCAGPADCSSEEQATVCVDEVCTQPEGADPAPDAGGDPEIDSQLNRQVCSSAEPCACGAQETCFFACPDGQCEFDCSADSACNVECGAGGCDLDCIDEATCQLFCTAGDCTATCTDTAFCRVVCDGGGCEQSCDSLDNCSLVCPAEPACVLNVN